MDCRCQTGWYTYILASSVFSFQNRCRHAFMGPECASSRHSKLFTSIQVASCIMIRVQDLGLSREGHKEVPACL